MGKLSRNEWVGIRDEDDPSPEEAESQHGLIGCVRDPEFPADWSFVSGKANAHLTELVSHEYKCAATIEGKLTESGTIKLRKLVLANLFDSSPSAKAKQTVMGEEDNDDPEEGEIVE